VWDTLGVGHEGIGVAKKRSKRTAKKRNVVRAARTGVQAGEVQGANDDASNLQVEHPTRFQPGVSGNPAGKKKGCRNASTRLWDAIESAEEEGFELFDHIVRRMKLSDPVLQSIAVKLLPTRVEGTVSPEDVNAVIQQVVAIVTEHVPDEKTINAIVTACESIDVPVQGKPL